MAIVHRCGSCGGVFKRFASAERCFERDHTPTSSMAIKGADATLGQMHSNAIRRAVAHRRRAQGRL